MIAEIKDDFDLRRIHESGQCFRWEPIGEDSFRIPFRGRCLRIEKRGEHTYLLDCTEEEYTRIWKPYFDLDENYACIRSMVDPREDPFLFHAVCAQTGIRILRQDFWETLVSFIVSQNRNIPLIRRSVERLCRTAGERRIDRAGEEFFTFPTAEAVLALTQEELLTCALGYRWRFVRAAAEYVCRETLDAEIFRGVSDDEALAQLQKICGVGVKVASCVALFALHRTDAFPIDVWVRRVLQNEYPQGYPFEKYRPYNGIFQQYMFACYRSKATPDSRI